MEATQCTARARSGNRCGQKAILGGTVCRFHGGAAPQVKRRAALRLAELVDPAIGTLAREMVKADKSSDRQRAANSILDRAGIARAPSSELDAARTMLMERLLAAREAEGLGPPAAIDAGELVATVVDDAPPEPKKRPADAPKKKPKKVRKK